MRPIDADAILQTHYSETEYIGKDWTIGDLVAAIELAPTLKVIPIEWLRQKTIGELLELSQDKL